MQSTKAERDHDSHLLGQLASRITRAHFEEEKSLEAFDFNFNPKVPAQYVRDLATCQFIERKQSIVFCGPVGVGKTHIAEALGHQACRVGYSVLFTKASRLLLTWEAAELMIPGRRCCDAT